MSHKHRNVLQAIFHDPLSSNIQWREVESLLHHLGATVEPGHGARFRVVLNRHEFTVHHPHHGNEFGKTDVKYLRECLAAAGISLSSYDEQHKAASSDG
ncbi:MAG: type II toxin-antitoxin system HicA family toxin [Sulfuritalea sp.]|nr:type II toxin-antitoxin system HicA family toxin [Sulfuritalea sp.]